MTCEMGLQIGGSLGKALEVDAPEDTISRGNYFRVKFEMDIRKAIARGRTVTLDEQKMQSPFTYEKLPKICFKCGCIIHREQGCVESGMKQDHSGEKESQFGPWLRANVSYRENYMGSTKGRENNNIGVRGGEWQLGYVEVGSGKGEEEMVEKGRKADKSKKQGNEGGKEGERD